MIKNNVCTLAGLTLALSFSVQAEQACQLTGSSTQANKNYIQCLDQNIAELEREQTIWINKLTLDLNKFAQDTGNTQLLPIFKRSLKEQQRYQEDSCRWRYLHKMPNNTKAAITYKLCEIDIIKHHIEVLKRPLK